MTRGLNNIGQKMTDKPDPDMTDIDAFLIEDSSVSKAKTKLSGAVDSLRAGAKPRRNKNPIVRLNSRVTHATRNITTALTSANELNKLLEDDQKGCDAFSEDIRDWDKVITDLEKAIHFIPEIDAIAIADEHEDNLHENIADAIASHLDAEIQNASEGPTEIVAARTDSPADIENDGPVLSEQDNIEATSNSDERQLLQSLEKQEARIRELEEQLEEQKSALQSTGTHANPAGEPSNLIERGDSNPNVNRLIISMNGDDNTKHPLSRNIMTIGREPHNDIHIRSRYISRFHARIVSDQDGSIIEDLGSRNGVAVNAKKVRRRQLRSGDLIDLGRVQLKYIDLMEGSASEGQA